MISDMHIGLFEWHVGTAVYTQIYYLGTVLGVLYVRKAEFERDLLEVRFSGHVQKNIYNLRHRPYEEDSVGF